MPVAGHVHKRCGCRNPQTGRQLGAHCPKLTTRGHGSWYLTLDIPASLDGARRRLRKGGFTSRRAAVRALAQLQTSGSDPQASLLTIAQWLRIWIASRVSLQPATLRNYTAHIDSYLIPHLGGIPLRDLSIRDMQHMFTTIMRHGTITRRPASATLLARLHATLRAALNAAVRENLLPDNPSRYIELPRLRRPHAVVWTSDQIAEWQRSGTRPRVAIWTAAQTATFLTAISGHRLYAVYHLITLRGLRRGEAAGLRWCDLDLDAALITINSQTQRLDGGGLAQCPPKTPTSRRTIALDRTTVTALRRHRDLQQADLALLD
ncbi:hypothetical protein ABGB14_29485 [Nonomuraea sp. B10E15]|uniref:site-specific integrase n=1 Tax=Nonomuraea sp. B10E15 TaxID=3153560 RepID=UPI00325F5A05